MPEAPCTIALIIVTVLFSFQGFRSPPFADRFLFSIPEILAGKEWHRLVTSAFLHADWMHLGMNMVTLFLFGQHIETHFGIINLLAIYFVSVIGGSLLSLWMHRHHEYRAWGASGGVCGVVFSFIVLFPGASLMMFPLPFWIPGWLYAIAYLAASVFAMHKRWDYVGHDAHIGGSMLGLWTSAALNPEIIRANWKVFLIVSGVGTLIFLFLVKNPMLLPPGGFFRKRPAKPEAGSHRARAAAIDAVLEKVSREGIHSLTPREKALLHSESEKYRSRADSKKPNSDLII